MTRAALVSNWQRLPHPVRWVGAAAVGGALVGVGLLLLVLPGPGIPLLLAGLVILATEFAWAQALLNRVKHHSSTLTSKVSDKVGRRRRSAR